LLRAYRRGGRDQVRFGPCEHRLTVMNRDALVVGDTETLCEWAVSRPGVVSAAYGSLEALRAVFGHEGFKVVVGHVQQLLGVE
jgi:hypothetical protein